MQRVAIYSRLSRDPTGEQTATARQEADCVAFAGLRGWEVGPTYSDVDLSAFRRSTIRPGFEEMLRAVSAREVDGIVVWKLDRLVRRISEFERLWKLCEDAGVFLASVNDSIDTSSATGRAMARIIATFAELESDTMSLRIRAAQGEQARAGVKHAGGKRPFGLDPTWTHVIEHEAEMIRDAAARVLDGQSLRSIVMEWNERGIRAPMGGLWKQASLRALLTSHRIAGDRSHFGQVVAVGQWPAILEREVAAQVREVLLDPLRKPPKAGRSFLLTGSVRCTCGTSMKGGVGSDKKGRYLCPPKPEGCNARSILADKLDGTVVDALCDALDGPELVASRDAADPPDTSVAEVDAAEAKLRELAQQWASDELSKDEWMAARSAVENRLRSARRAVSSRRHLTLVAEHTGHGAQLRADWDGLPFVEQRAFVDALIDRIVILPGRGGRFDAGRVDITWRT